MDQPQSSSLMGLIAAVPDPRKARGKQLEWPFIWGVLGSAMLSERRTPVAIAQGAQRQATTLVSAFRPARGRVPSEATIRRALQRVDVMALERQVAQLAALPAGDTTAPPHAPQG